MTWQWIMSPFRRIGVFWSNPGRCRGRGQSSFQSLLEQKVVAAVERGELARDDVESFATELTKCMLPELSAALLSEFQRRAPAMLREHRRLELKFQSGTYRRWKAGLDLIKLMLVVSEEVGAKFNTDYRPQAAEENDARFEAIVTLHARALQSMILL